jgi:hypothetical protein
LVYEILDVARRVLKDAKEAGNEDDGVTAANEEVPRKQEAEQGGPAAEDELTSAYRRCPMGLPIRLPSPTHSQHNASPTSLQSQLFSSSLHLQPPATHLIPTSSTPFLSHEFRITEYSNYTTIQSPKLLMRDGEVDEQNFPTMQSMIQSLFLQGKMDMHDSSPLPNNHILQVRKVCSGINWIIFDLSVP